MPAPDILPWIIAVVAALAVGLLVGRRSAMPSAPTDPAQTGPTLQQLQALNALLRTLTSSPDVPQSLFDLALRIREIVPCDRVGLALLTSDQTGYTTYTARLDSARSPAPRADLHFPRGATVIDEVVTSRQARIYDDVTELAPVYLDANVAKSAGFSSFAVVPLIFDGEVLGTLNLASRKPAAFADADLHSLQPVAEALAVAHGTRRLADALARHELAHELAEMTFAFANDINGAVQAIVGQCELLVRRQTDRRTERELAAIQRQAQRLREIVTNMQRTSRAQPDSPAFGRSRAAGSGVASSTTTGSSGSSTAQ